MKTFSTRAVLSSGDGGIIETLPFFTFSKSENRFPSERLSTILNTFQHFERVHIQSPY